MREPVASVQIGPSDAEDDFSRTLAESANVGADGVEERAVPPYSWYVLACMALAFTLAFVDRSIVPVVLEPIGKEFALDDAQLGFLAGLCFSLTYTLSALPLGILVDRVNRRNLLGCVLGLWSLLTALCGYTQNFLQLAITRMAVGAAEAGLPAAVSLITDYFPPIRRPMALGVYIAGGSFAYVISFGVGGWVAQEWGWRHAFFVVGLPGLILSAVIFLTIREPVRGATEGNAKASSEAAPGLFETLRHMMRCKSLFHIFVGYVIVAATISSFWSWIASLLIRVHHLNIRDAGLVVAVGAGLCGFMGAIGGAYLADIVARRGMKAVLYFVVIGAALVTPLGVAMSLSTNTVTAIGFMVAMSIVKSAYPGPAQAILVSLAKVRMRGVMTTLLSLLGTLLGFGVGPLIAGGVSQILGGGEAIRFGLATLFLFNLWAATHFWLARRTLESDLKATSS